MSDLARWFKQWQSIRRILYEHTGIFLILVSFFYSFTMLLHPDHFSFWALGDAQMMIAARHFVEEGFFEHHFLPMVTPGFLIDRILNNAPDGHYLHYPAIHAVIAGFVLKVVQVEAVAWMCVRMIALSFATAGSVLWYYFLRKYFGWLAASIVIFGTVFSTVYFQFADSICNQAYDIFFRFAFIYFFDRYLEEDQPKFLRYICSLIIFFASLNTIETMPFLIAFVFCLATVHRKKSFMIFLNFGAIAFFGYALHFMQVLWHWAEYSQGFLDAASKALADWFGISAQRASGSFVFLVQEYVLQSLQATNAFVFCILVCVLFILLIWFVRKNQHSLTNKIFFNAIEKKSWFVLLSLIVATPIFDFFLTGQAINMRQYMILQYYPFLGFFLALLIRWIERISFELIWAEYLFRGCLFVLITLQLWSVSPYLYGHPHRFAENVKTTGPLWGMNPEFNFEDYQVMREAANFIRNYTAFGDNIIIPEMKFAWWGEEGLPVFQYFADRRMMGDMASLAGLQSRIDVTLQYKSRLHLDERLAGMNIYYLVASKYSVKDLVDYAKEKTEQFEFIAERKTERSFFRLYKIKENL